MIYFGGKKFEKGIFDNETERKSKHDWRSNQIITNTAYERSDLV